MLFLYDSVSMIIMMLFRTMSFSILVLILVMAYRVN